MLRAAFLLVAIPCCAQVTVQAVTDSAGYGPRVAPGSLATIFGTNLASGTTQATDYPLNTNLGGTTVLVQGTAAPLYYVSSGVVNFQVPSSTPAGQVSLVVQAPGGNSSSFTFTVIAEAPAIFQYGSNHAVAQNNDAAHSTNSASNPAPDGSVITVYLTGQGAVTNPVADGNAAPVSPLSSATATYSATIGTQKATVQFLGLAPTFAGVAQANIQVPNLPTGDYPLVITVGGFVSTSAVVSVSGSGTFTNPLTLAGSVSFAAVRPSSVALLNNTAYICGSNQITMVDVTDPTQPSVLGEFGDSVLNGRGQLCAINAQVSNPYLVEVVYASNPANSPSFAVWDLTRPTSPSLLGTTSAQYPYIVSLNFAGTYGFASTSYFTYNPSNAIISQTGEYLAFNFTTPGAPQLLSVLSPSSLSDQTLKPDSAVVDATFAYIASTTATGGSTSGSGVLDVIGVSSPTAMYNIEQVPVAQAAILLSVDVSGNTLLACGNTTGNRNPGTPNFGFTGDLTLTTMDISNVVAPAVLTSFDTGLQVNGTFHTAGFSSGAFAIVNNAPVSDPAGPASLAVVDARQPSSPILYPVATQFGYGGMVATTGGYLIAANSLGVNIYRLQF